MSARVTLSRRLASTGAYWPALAFLFAAPLAAQTDVQPKGSAQDAPPNTANQHLYFNVRNNDTVGANYSFGCYGIAGAYGSPGVSSCTVDPPYLYGVWIGPFDGASVPVTFTTGLVGRGELHLRADGNTLDDGYYTINVVPYK